MNKKLNINTSKSKRKTYMATDELDQFINEMLDAKKLTGVAIDVRIQLVSDLKERLLDQINRALIDSLPDDKMEEFESLLDNPNIGDTAVQQFIADSGIDVKKITTTTMLRFYDLYVASSKEPRA